MRKKTFHSHRVDNVLMKLNKDRKTDAKYCDFRISVNGQTFPIHKSIVGPQSDYFDKMFFSQMKEQNQHQATIEAITKETMEAILDFFYSGSIEITCNNVCGIMEAANYFNVSDVKNYCAELLLDEAKPENCLRLKKILTMYDCRYLLERVEKVIEKNFEAVVGSYDFQFLELKEVISVLQQKRNNSSASRSVLKNTTVTLVTIAEVLRIFTPLMKSCMGAINILSVAFHLIDLGYFPKSYAFKFERVVNQSKNTSETLTFFIRCFKHMAKYNWKDDLLSALEASRILSLHRIFKCYFNENKVTVINWFIDNWNLLQDYEEKVIVAAQKLGCPVYVPMYEKSQLVFYLGETAKFDDVVGLQLIKKLEKQIPAAITTSFAVCEDRVYDAVIGWIKHDVSKRASHLFILFSMIQIEQISRYHIDQVVMKEPLIQ